MSEEYLILGNGKPLPGNLVSLTTSDKFGRIQELRSENRYGRYFVSAAISDHLPLTNSLQEILAIKCYRMINVSGLNNDIYLKSTEHFVIIWGQT